MDWLDREEVILNLIGIFLTILGLASLIHMLIFGVAAHALWLCNHVIILMGIAILFRSSFWLIAEFCFLFFGQLFWIVSFLLFVFFEIQVPGSSAYLIYSSEFIHILSIAIHFLTLPLGFWAIWILGKKQKFAWVGGLVHAAILIPPVLILGREYNLNCFYEPCFKFIPNPVPELWSVWVIILYFGFLVIPLNYLVNWILKKRS